MKNTVTGQITLTTNVKVLRTRYEPSIDRHQALLLTAHGESWISVGDTLSIVQTLSVKPETEIPAAVNEAFDAICEKVIDCANAMNRWEESK